MIAPKPIASARYFFRLVRGASGGNRIGGSSCSATSGGVEAKAAGSNIEGGKTGSASAGIGSATSAINAASPSASKEPWQREQSDCSVMSLIAPQCGQGRRFNAAPQSLQNLDCGGLRWAQYGHSVMGLGLGLADGMGSSGGFQPPIRRAPMVPTHPTVKMIQISRTDPAAARRAPLCGVVASRPTILPLERFAARPWIGRRLR